MIDGQGQEADPINRLAKIERKWPENGMAQMPMDACQCRIRPNVTQSDRIDHHTIVCWNIQAKKWCAETLKLRDEVNRLKENKEVRRLEIMNEDLQVDVEHLKRALRNIHRDVEFSHIAEIIEGRAKSILTGELLPEGWK